MADVTPTTVDPKVQAVLTDAVATEKLAVAIVQAFKTQGMAGAAAQLPVAVGVVEKDIADETAAIPVVKAGLKTSEFWISALSAGAITVLGAYTKLPPATLITISSALGAIAAVYTVVRGMVKSSTPTK